MGGGASCPPTTRPLSRMRSRETTVAPPASRAVSVAACGFGVGDQGWLVLRSRETKDGWFVAPLGPLPFCLRDQDNDRGAS